MLILLVLAAAGAMFIPRIFGIRPLGVMTGSMKPKYPVGSMVYVKKTDFEKIKPDDVITYILNEKNTLVTHRVVSIDEETEHFITKGDSNAQADIKPVSYKNVVGVVEFSLPLLGYFAIVTANTSGKIIVITIAVMIVLISIVFKNKKSGGNENDNKDEKFEE